MLLAFRRTVLVFVTSVIAFSLVGATTFTTFLSTALHIVETIDVLLLEQIDRTLHLALAIGLQRLGTLATLVHLYDGKCPTSCYCNQICRNMLVSRICYLATHDVALEEIVCTVLRLEFNVTVRQTTRSLNIGIDLIVKAALELCTLSGKFLWIE